MSMNLKLKMEQKSFDNKHPSLDKIPHDVTKNIFEDPKNHPSSEITDDTETDGANINSIPHLEGIAADLPTNSTGESDGNGTYADGIAADVPTNSTVESEENRTYADDYHQGYPRKHGFVPVFSEINGSVVLTSSWMTTRYEPVYEYPLDPFIIKPPMHYNISNDPVVSFVWKYKNGRHIVNDARHTIINTAGRDYNTSRLHISKIDLSDDATNYVCHAKFASGVVQTSKFKLVVDTYECLPGWKILNFRCYRADNRSMAFQDALKACQESGYHGGLATARNKKENDFVNEHRGDSAFWLDGRWSMQNYDFYWQGRHPKRVQWTNWKTNTVLPRYPYYKDGEYPCITMGYASSKWEYRNCFKNEFPFMCMMPAYVSN